MPADQMRRLMKRHLRSLQRHLREGARLGDCGLTPAGGVCDLWLECAMVGGDRGRLVPPPGEAVVWRGRGVIASPSPRRPADPVFQRSLLLALADALADVACRSEVGLALWCDGVERPAERTG